MGSLDGIRVLTVENFIAGPYASMWLADKGAEVIKVEAPGVGDSARSVPPQRQADDGEHRSLSFMRANRSKKSITLNLKTEKGRSLFKELVRQSDVIIDNLRPDVMVGLGLDYANLASLNPRLIYTSISGFGHRDVMPGPYSDRPAFDVIGQAMSGLMFRPEREVTRPVYLGFPLADIYGATLAVLGTIEAIYEREGTGRGQRVDIALYDAALVMNELSTIMYGTSGQVPSPGLHALTAPFGGFRAKDGYVAIAVLGERIWTRFCEAIDRKDLVDDPGLQDGVMRHHASDRLKAIIEDWLSDKSRDEAVDHLLGYGVPAGPVNDIDDVFECPQAEARKMLIEVTDPAWGEVTVVGNPVKLSRSGLADPGSPPGLGADTESVLNGLLGLTADDVQDLRDSHVI